MKRFFVCDYTFHPVGKVLARNSAEALAAAKEKYPHGVAMMVWPEAS